MNIRMHRSQIQGRIDYVGKNMNSEPGRVIETYSGGLYKYFGNTVDI